VLVISIAYISVYNFQYGSRNGEEWYKLKKNVQQAMLRPQSVFAYIPMVDQVATDFIAYLKKIKDADGRIAHFKNDVAKWSLESNMSFLLSIWLDVFLASAMLVFEKRLGAFDANIANIQKIIDSNWTMFDISGKLKFSLPLYQILPTPKWKKLVEAEDFFYS